MARAELGAVTAAAVLCWLLLAAIPAACAFAGSACRLAAPTPAASSALLLLVHHRFHEVVVDAKTVLDKATRSKIGEMVAARAAARWEGDYKRADELRQHLMTVELPDPVLTLALQDIPRERGGGSQWSLIYHLRVQQKEKFAAASVNDDNNKKAVLHLAHSALGLAVSCAERGIPVPALQLQEMEQQAVHQLEEWKQVDQYLRLRTAARGNGMGRICVSYDKLKSLIAACDGDDKKTHRLSSWNAVEVDLGGRKAADAAFWFAVAGAQNNNLYFLLTAVCVKELERFGERPSCRAQDVFQIVQRFAAAGIKNKDASMLESVARDSLKFKGVEMDETKRLLDLHSDHSAMMLWRFSARQRKQIAFLQTTAKHWEARVSNPEKQSTVHWVPRQVETWNWEQLFDDISRPLVCDLGCGMGVSLLGLASLENASTHDGFDWSQCNFIGVDLSHLTINYAQSIAHRWNIDRKVAFVVATAESLLKHVVTYPGRVQRILIQFPTPYRLPNDYNDTKNPGTANGGNSQLPKSVEDGFMVTPSLLQQCSAVLRPANGELLMQSNCEDVAVWMRSTACEKAGFVLQDSSTFVTEIAGTPLQRTLNWVAMGGNRATGTGWSSAPILPRTGRTETEIACKLNDKPVHRCILKAT